MIMMMMMYLTAGVSEAPCGVVRIDPLGPLRFLVVHGDETRFCLSCLLA